MNDKQRLGSLIVRLSNQSKWTRQGEEYQCRLDDAKICLQLKQNEFILRILGTGGLTLDRYTFDDSDPYMDNLCSIYEQARKCSQQYGPDVKIKLRNYRQLAHDYLVGKPLSIGELAWITDRDQLVVGKTDTSYITFKGEEVEVKWDK